MTAQRPLRILQINTTDGRGGAAKVAWNLFEAYRARGHDSWLIVGEKESDDPGVFALRHDQCRSRWTRLCFALGDKLSPSVGEVPGAGRLRRWLRWWIGQPGRKMAIELGQEDFEFPGTWHLLDLPPGRPDIVHCHNLHGGYFDLRALSWLSQQVPVVLTLHDAWMLSGHCAHSFDCERWKKGCGDCPDLTIYPEIRRDGTARNWRRKRGIYARSRLYVAAPSRWLMEKVEQSVLAPAMVGRRVIHNGVDLSVFHPADKRAVRTALDLPQDAKILLFAANGIRRNRWKDYATLRRAVALIAEGMEHEILFVALGEEAPDERIGAAEVTFVPYQSDPRAVARYYQAADLYLHAAKVDNFPNTVIEALACGTPVVGTAVGGISEQIEDGISGFRVPPCDSEAIAEQVGLLLRNGASLARMSEDCRRMAEREYSLNLQASRYLDVYEHAIEEFHEVPNSI